MILSKICVEKIPCLKVEMPIARDINPNLVGTNGIYAIPFTAVTGLGDPNCIIPFTAPISSTETGRSNLSLASRTMAARGFSRKFSGIVHVSPLPAEHSDFPISRRSSLPNTLNLLQSQQYVNRLRDSGAGNASCFGDITRSRLRHNSKISPHGKLFW